MNRPAETVYELVGCPSQAGCTALTSTERCRVCGEMVSHAAQYDQWQGANFTDQNKLRHIAGRVVCAVCVWAHAWNAPPGAPPTAQGKKGLNLRLFSHLYDARGYRYANKADKATIREWLCAPKSPPWFAAIADSGQKHVLPWATFNHDDRCGVVRFEELDVQVFGDDLRGLCDATCALLTAGVTKDEIETGEYRPQTWVRCERAVRAYELAFARDRGGGLFALALWLSQRDEAEVARRMAAEVEAKEAERGRRKARQAARSSRGHADGDTQRVPRKRGKRTEALGSDPGPSAACDEDERPDRGVDHNAREGAPAREPEQLSFGSIDGARR